MNLPDKFLLFVILYGAGVFTASFLFISWIWILLFLVFICSFALWSFLCHKKLLIFVTAATLFAFGVISFQTSDYYNQKSSSIRWNGDFVKASGVVCDEPEFKESSVWLRVELKDNYQGKILIKTKPYTKNFQYGDEIVFEGKLEEPENFSDFDFKAYLSKEGIYSIANYPKVEIIKNHQGSAIKSSLLKVKNLFEEKIDTILPEPESSFLGGLLLGERQSLDAGLKEKMQKSGTSHLVALSGYNITIICTAVLSLLLFFGLKRNIAFWLSVLFIVVFVLMTGASASVVRAGIMGGLLLLSQRIGRLYHPRNALFLAGIIMVIINPKILRFDFAFQLSFAATLGLIYFYPFFEKVLKSDQSSFLNWRGVLATTLSAQFAVLPLIVLRFGYFPLVSPLSNIFILSLIPITMLFGFLAGVSGLIFSGLAMIFGLLSYLLLKMEILIIDFFGSLKFAIISLDKVREWVFWLAVGIVILMFVYIQKKRLKYLKYTR
ncbi:MAG TPA: ComEC/Rec2 family competence protein [Candidatus Paceibacterota bacterium]|nr:ComEC/Rec2 family competence protein [Candidatus Paceibacterota bacterium]HPT40017.1 ComEC/Rec2 family competence protein [Candidatus Paceibacterota bacterium]